MDIVVFFSDKYVQFWYSDLKAPVFIIVFDNRCKYCAVHGRYTRVSSCLM